MGCSQCHAKNEELFFLRQKVEWLESKVKGLEETHRGFLERALRAAYEQEEVIERLKRTVKDLQVLPRDESTPSRPTGGCLV